jgi:hypothetical protein
MAAERGVTKKEKKIYHGSKLWNSKKMFKKSEDGRKK